MTPKLLRLAYAGEFLLAVIAIFTSWSEIGGQDVLDLMHWGWKLGLGLALAFATVAFTGAIVSVDSIWTLRSARWLSIIVLIVIAMGVVTYYYRLQTNLGESDETGNVSQIRLHQSPASCS